MRVAYPRGGPHVLVLFHSSWRKGHGILARTWEQAEKVFRSAEFQRHIRKQCDLRVERALDIDIVSAPPSWRREIAAKVYREERVNFRNNLLLSVRDLPTLGSGVIHPEPRHPGDAATKSRHSATLGRWRKVAQHFSGEAVTLVWPGLTPGTVALGQEPLNSNRREACVGPAFTFSRTTSSVRSTRRISSSSITIISMRP